MPHVDILQFLLDHGIQVIVLALVIAGLGLPIPEDIMLLAAGVLVSRHDVTFVQALIACAVGVFIGDTTIFLLARKLGPSALERRPFKWLITPQRREKIEELFARYGNVIVFMARHMAGLRAPTFAMAGMHAMPISRFWLWDGLGLCVSAPVVISIGWWLADNIELAEHYLQRFEFLIMGLIAAAIVGFFVWRKVKRTSAAAQQ